MRRRHWLQGAVSAALLGPRWVGAQARMPLADMHSHFGLIHRQLASSGLAEELRSQGVALMAWKLVSDGAWLHRGPSGIDVVGTPQPGQFAARFNAQIGRMRAYLREHELKAVLSAADVDACIAPNGEPGVVLASEGSHFLEGRVENLDAAIDKGLRHLQLVHFVPAPAGDHQTMAPQHHGLSEMGWHLIEACNAKHVLVDLAHAAMPTVEQALEASNRPLIWSHGWVDRVAGRWLDATTMQQRRLSIEHAKKIANRGGVVGLWGLALNRPGAAWTAGRGAWTVALHDTAGYARELANLVDKIGSDHVAFGTDIEGVGQQWSVNDYAGVRDVVQQLEQLKLPSETIERVAYANYARVLKAALA
ncbi:MAG TPA: membrane dipeptidase [Burkholderiaceae bacterium]|nr:membrane dipeptidase [Burkholderiaceae bacterium]